MLLTAKQYADQVGVSARRIRDKIKSGLLPAKKIGTQWLIDSETPWIKYNRNREEVK